MSQLIDQLTRLQNALAQLGERYQTAQTELSALKARPNIEPDELNQLKNQSSIFREQTQTLQQQLAQQEQRYRELEQRYQSLADSHSLLGAELEQANEQIHTLHADNQKLIDKNRVAAEHAKVVLERLTKIDNEA